MPRGRKKSAPTLQCFTLSEAQRDSNVVEYDSTLPEGGTVLDTPGANESSSASTKSWQEFHPHCEVHPRLHDVILEQVRTSLDLIQKLVEPPQVLQC
mmetsp:Transcript_31396/g.73274  ORF Transcript_31396/g.73274 Transcript_31396/m.73274 type:complete len:97 (-) Transcript_31396:414-704(-)